MKTLIVWLLSATMYAIATVAFAIGALFAGAAMLISSLDKQEDSTP